MVSVVYFFSGSIGFSMNACVIHIWSPRVSLFYRKLLSRSVVSFPFAMREIEGGCRSQGLVNLAIELCAMCAWVGVFCEITSLVLVSSNGVNCFHHRLRPN